MPLDAVSAASGATLTGTAATSKPKQEMDGDMFMKLLIIQLKNQDPTSPMDTNAMMGQTTQLSMMKALTGIQETSAQGLGLQMRTSAADLIGKQVSFPDGSGTSSGSVTAVSFSGGVPTVTVNGRDIPLDALTVVTTV